jgi:hypothetical protein
LYFLTTFIGKYDCADNHIRLNPSISLRASQYMHSMQGLTGVMRAGSGLQNNVVKIRALDDTVVGGPRMPVLPQVMRKQTSRLHRQSVAAEKQANSKQEQPHKVHEYVHAAQINRRACLLWLQAACMDFRISSCRQQPCMHECLL